jgi:hypothetical protein
MTTAGSKFWLTVATVVVFPLAVARANSPGGRYTIGTGTILDTKTNLTWQQPAPTGTYTWANAKTYCSTLGTGWRLPTIKELQTLVDYSRSDSPKIDSAFSGTVADHYWSSTVLAGSPSSAWSLGFSDGLTGNPDLPVMIYVRCVR